MRRIGRLHRTSPADAFGSVHERAHVRAAQRIDGPLGARESAWLDEHLAECERCRSAASAYRTQAEALRTLSYPEPPRDLWARTSAALDREAPVRRRGRPSFRSFVPVGALAGVLVVAVVVGASLFTPGVPQGTTGLGSPTSAGTAVAIVPQSTPLVVPAGKVQFLARSADGRYQLTSAAVHEVCSGASAASCPALAATSAGSMVLPDTPGSVIISPNDKQLVVVDQAATTSGGAVSVVAVPTVPPSPGTSPSPAVATQIPSIGQSPAPSPTPTPVPSPSPSPTSTATPTAGGSASPSPSGEPTPTVLAIAQDVILVGQSAAYSGSGQWFAFSARPADGSHGPDIYVWSPGQAAARAVTTDHRSIFSTWVGEEILGSRAVGSVPATPPGSPEASVSPATPAAPATPSPSDSGLGQLGPLDLAAASDAAAASSAAGSIATAQSFVVDPATGFQRAINGDGLYRPVIDPTNRYVVYWQGTIRSDAQGLTWQPADGHLVLARWDASTLFPSPSPSADPGGPSATPSPTDPLPAASPVSDVVSLSSGPIPDFDVRWDEDGAHLAVWIAESFDNGRGRLTLHTVDPTGLVDPSGPLVVDQPALAGYSIEAGRLAWVTVPGTGGEGSRIEVLAWQGQHAGTIQSQPGTDLSVVH